MILHRVSSFVKKLDKQNTLNKNVVYTGIIYRILFPGVIFTSPFSFTLQLVYCNSLLYDIHTTTRPLPWTEIHLSGL